MVIFLGHLADFWIYSPDPTLISAPINPSWILEGNPEARNNVLATGSDGSARTIIWDCSAGRFNWYYSIDETAVIQEGSVTLDDGKSPPRTLHPGDIVFFPRGSHALWHVEKYVRKVAFCHDVLPGRLAKPAALLRRIDRRLRRGSAGSAVVMP